MLKFAQFSIVAAVLLSNAEWKWTPNGYLAGAVAACVAAAFTALVMALQKRRSLTRVDGLARGRASQQHSKKPIAIGRRLP